MNCLLIFLSVSTAISGWRDPVILDIWPERNHDVNCEKDGTLPSEASSPCARTGLPPSRSFPALHGRRFPGWCMYMQTRASSGYSGSRGVWVLRFILMRQVFTCLPSHFSGPSSRAYAADMHIGSYGDSIKTIFRQRHYDTLVRCSDIAVIIRWFFAYQSTLELNYVDYAPPRARIRLLGVHHRKSEDLPFFDQGHK